MMYWNCKNIPSERLACLLTSLNGTVRQDNNIFVARGKVRKATKGEKVKLYTKTLSYACNRILLHLLEDLIN